MNLSFVLSTFVCFSFHVLIIHWHVFYVNIFYTTKIIKTIQLVYFAQDVILNIPEFLLFLLAMMVFAASYAKT